MGILAAATFAVGTTEHRTKQKNPGELVFGQEMILPINHILIWKYICQRKQEQIEKYVIRENFTRINCSYNIGDKVMVSRNQAYKCETTFQGLCEIIQTWTMEPLLYKQVRSHPD